MPPVPMASPEAPCCHRPLLLVTEGVLDITCLKRFAHVVRQINPDLPDLDRLSQQGRLVCLPAGGGDLAAWADRLAPLGCPEFHLYDREQEPESSLRQQIVARINGRPRCRAVLTQKRSLENYLHPAAIQAVFGVQIKLTEKAPVAERVASALPDWKPYWPELPYRARQRRILRTKRRLNQEAARRMTPDLLREVDPFGEVCDWFRQMDHLLADRASSFIPPC